MAQPAAQVQALDYGRKKYVRYHGSNEGWDQLVKEVTRSASILPSAEFTIRAAPNPAEIALKTVQEHDISALPASDWELVLAQASASPANKAAADKVWATIQAKQKPGNAKLKLHAKVISSSGSEILAAISDENQAVRRADLKATMHVPLPHPPMAGAIVDVAGVLFDYSSRPFVFYMTDAELAAVFQPRPPD